MKGAAMDEFKARQLSQIRFGIADFREGKIPLNTLVAKLEGAARAIGQDFWEQEVFAVVLDLEQINVDVVEERRALVPHEKTQVELLITRLEARLDQVE